MLQLQESHLRDVFLRHPFFPFLGRFHGENVSQMVKTFCGNVPLAGNRATAGPASHLGCSEQPR